ncbi:hypothetical protein SAY86_026449 [Trapa natans]|uniref:Golgin candidate 6 n=1 Tax=Trapa natans TaxID=22666 RepID=A0AAN7KHX7_TRANT|nr:hypothetical protein SAY86_026449 [Trapa natans]
MGFPVLMSVLKEERYDVEMVRGSLEILVSALTPIDHAKGPVNEIQPALINADLLAREAESISLLLSLLAEEDFYVRYYTLQLLTALLSNSHNRLQEVILSIPRGITRLMDMLMDREVIRNEALLLLTYLTSEAEVQAKIDTNIKGAFEKIFSIIREESGSDGGVVVQDCLELLNNLLRNNASDQSNSDGQAMLASTLIPQPESLIHSLPEEDVHMSFGSMLLQGLTMSENEVDLETCSPAANVLSHVLKDNRSCKERAIQIELEAPTLSLGAPEPLIHRMVKYLALASHQNASATVCIRGLAAVLLGECVLYNKSTESRKDSFSIVDSISQKIGITAFLIKFDEMQTSSIFSSVKSAQPRRPLTRSTAASMVEIEDEDEDESELPDQKNEDHHFLDYLCEMVLLLKNLPRREELLSKEQMGHRIESKSALLGEIFKKPLKETNFSGQRR